MTALDPHNNQRAFSCRLTSIEANFDFLNHIVAQGNTLLSAYVVENFIRTDLPLAAFDGLPASVAIQALEQEWQAILSSPPLCRSIHYQELIGLIRRRIDGYEINIATHKLMIDWFSRWLQQTQDKTLLEPARSKLIQQYECQLNAHQVQLDKARFYARLATSRLNQLVA